MNKNIKNLLILVSLANILDVSSYAAENIRVNLIDKFNNCNSGPLFGNIGNDEDTPYILDSSSESERYLMDTPPNRPLTQDYGSKKKSKKFDLTKIKKSKLITNFIRLELKFPKNTPKDLASICEKLLLSNLDLHNELHNYSIVELESILDVIKRSEIPLELNNRTCDLMFCINQIKNNSSIDIPQLKK